MKTIDINCDMGEGMGNEEAIMPYINSCNIACGGHAGDTAIMKSTVDLTLKYDVKIGAHPSYPDKKNFGRHAMKISSEDLTTTIENQIKALKIIAESSGSKLHHIKPHGALYNEAAKDKSTAEAVLNAINSFDDNLFLYAPYKSIIANLALDRGIKVIFEAFADRAYNDNLQLVNRSIAGSVLENKEDIYEQVCSIITQQRIESITGKQLHLEANTICIHGDNPKAVEIVKFIHQKLNSNSHNIA
ncbi:5-oxoprolinase subunit PxpA [Reichenbachiella sp. MALMAid0571]|uniref:5-oxoprolinase subunit PxpA n=1 Tax=Reichenbachiella sp. MALMAid0571 TaxID=3143939 RepID=UPI0032DF3E19